MMNRIILHWTAGAPGVIPIEADAYHFIIGWPDGTVTEGLDHVGANVPPLRSGHYAAHTRNLNSHSIGVAIDAMAGARERPFDPGKYPITEAQVDVLVDLCARLMRQYDIPLSRETVLTHAEVQPTLGVAQHNKWDITWLPGMDYPVDPVLVGDVIRDQIRQHMNTSAPAGPWAWITTLLRRIFGKGD